MTKLPPQFVQFKENYPNLFEAYEQLGKTASESGPLDQKQKALVKLAIATGGRLEGAVHAHTRRALKAGATPDEIRHVVLLSVTTLGFPTMMATLSWVNEVLKTHAENT